MKREIRIVDGKEEKKCTKCQIWLPNTLKYFCFTQGKTRKCRACINKYSREYRSVHKEGQSTPTRRYKALRTVDGRQERRCTGCQQWKPNTPEFYRKLVDYPDRNPPYRTRSFCKECQTEKDRVKFGHAKRPIRIRTVNGIVERICANCNEWKPNATEFYLANSIFCRICSNKVKFRMVDGITERKCSVCGEWKPNTFDFYYETARQVKTPLHKTMALCKVCMIEKYCTGSYRDNAIIQRHNRRARKRGVEGTYKPEDIQRQYKAQEGKCYYCSKKIKDGYEIDHIVPLSRDGSSNSPSNLVLTCSRCNRKKHNRLPHEWPEGNRLL